MPKRYYFSKDDVQAMLFASEDSWARIRVHNPPLEHTADEKAMISRAVEIKNSKHYLVYTRPYPKGRARSRESNILKEWASSPIVRQELTDVLTHQELEQSVAILSNKYLFEIDVLGISMHEYHDCEPYRMENSKRNTWSIDSYEPVETKPVIRTNNRDLWHINTRFEVAGFVPAHLESFLRGAWREGQDCHLFSLAFFNSDDLAFQMEIFKDGRVVSHSWMPHAIDINVEKKLVTVTPLYLLNVKRENGAYKYEVDTDPTYIEDLRYVG